MPLPVRLHAEAEAEYLDAAGYYGARSLAVGHAFVDRVEAALAWIAELPLAAPAWPGRPDIRKRVLAQFPYSIIYVVEPQAILVVAIEHAKQRPGKWLRRL